MLFFQLKCLSSLRELQTHILNNNKLRGMINVSSVCEFSRKNTNRDYRIFEELRYTVCKATKMFGIQRINKDFPIIKIIDFNMID